MWINQNWWMTSIRWTTYDIHFELFIEQLANVSITFDVLFLNKKQQSTSFRVKTPIFKSISNDISYVLHHILDYIVFNQWKVKWCLWTTTKTSVHCAKRSIYYRKFGIHNKNYTFHRMCGLVFSLKYAYSTSISHIAVQFIYVDKSMERA